MSVFYGLRAVMTAVGVLFLPAVLIFPQLKAYTDLFTWILYGIYLLVVLFLWGISGKGNRRVADGFDPNADNQFLNETKSKLLFNSRLHWFK